MNLGGNKDLIVALGGKVGRTYVSALKRAAGVSSLRRFDIDAVVQWRKENPNGRAATCILLKLDDE